jgi:RHS repeat-associated protein
MNSINWVRELRLALLAIICGVTLAFHMTPAAAQSSSTAGYCTPNGWSSQARCMPLQLGPWSYDAYDLPYGGPGPKVGYDSLSTLLEAIDARFQPSECGDESFGPAVVYETNYYAGVEYRKYRNFSITFYQKIGNPAVCGPVQSNGQTIEIRTVTCPPGWAVVSVGTKGVCACTATSLCPPPPRCCAGLGGVSVGKPIDIMLGSEQFSETDYSGAGAFPLAFNRTYSSAAIQAAAQPPNPLGTGWAATYLQTLVYIGDGGFPGVIAFRPDGSVLTFNEVSGAFYFNGTIRDTVQWTYDGSGNKTGFLYTTSADSREQYDLTGRLLSITSRQGVVHTLTYDSNGLLSTVTDSFGHVLQFAWTKVGGDYLLQAITLPGGSEIQYSYDANKNLSAVTYADSTQRQYVYEIAGRPHLLTGIIDENNIRYATIGYDSSSRANSTQLAGGVDAYSVTYNGNTSRTVVDPLGTSRTYTLSATRGELRYTAVSSTCRGCSHFAAAGYDTNGNANSTTDFNGNQTTYVSDLVRNLETSRTEAVGTPHARTIGTTWHASLQLPLTVTEPNRTTTNTYDTAGNLLTRTITDTTVSPNVDRTWTYTYDSFGQALTADGPRTDVPDTTTYTYYNCTTGVECGRLHTITDALNHTTTFNTYNVHGQPLTITDANGVVTSMTYDARQRLLTTTIGAETTSYSYWPTGLLKKVTRPDNSYLLYTYDNAHRLTRVEDGDGNREEYVLDAKGNRTSTSNYDPSNALAQSRGQVFNSLNQLWKHLNSAGGVMNVLVYDSNGNIDSDSAALGRVTSNEYDALNRLAQVTDPSAGVTNFTYDGNDNLLSVEDPRGLLTTYAYTGFGEVKTLTSPDTGVTSNTYDSGGNLKTATDARSIQGTYSYDALNRVTSIAYPDQTVSFTYDSGANGVGRLTGASDASHSLAWGYDANGRVVSKTQVVGSLVRSVTYTYTNGNLTSILTPSGQTVSYGYSNGRVSSVSVNGTSVLGNVLYEPFGDVRQWTWGNSSAVVRTHDLDGNLGQVDSGGDFYTFSRDDAFRITSISNSSDANLSWTFGYDLNDRLTSASSTPLSRAWGYDANGNRTTEGGATAGTPLSNTFTPATTSNRLASVSGSRSNAYTYDAAGHTQTESNAGRPISAAGTIATTYTYNALSQRVAKSSSGGSRFFFYDEAGHLLGEYASNGDLIQETVWMGDVPVATLRPHAEGGVDIYYVHTDQLNAPRKITRPSDNAIVWRWDPSPFGNTLPNENMGSVGIFQYNLRFPGQYYDAESGLSYNYMRDYDPATGRYIESDPVGLAGGVNTYAYADLDPISFVDPLGLQAYDPGPPPADPAPGKRNPDTNKRRDPRTPWLPPNLQQKGHCPPYYRISFGSDEDPRSGLIPLVSEALFKETECEQTYICGYYGKIGVGIRWNLNSKRIESRVFRQTIYVRVRKEGPCCGAN